EGVDPFAGRTRRLLHDREFRKSRQHEDARLLELAMTDLYERLHHQLDLLLRQVFADGARDRFEDRALGEGLVTRLLRCLSHVRPHFRSGLYACLAVREQTNFAWNER